MYIEEESLPSVSAAAATDDDCASLSLPQESESVWAVQSVIMQSLLIQMKLLLGRIKILL